MSCTDDQKRVVIIGGGITGLAAAYRLTELDPTLDVVLLEAGDRLGGVLKTVQRDGYLIEHSADNFITNIPWAVDLCRRIGLGDELISTRTQQRGALVVHKGNLVRVPAGFMLLAPARLWPLVTTPILSPAGKLRLLAEQFVPRRTDESDESLASFTRRRLGRETFDRIVQPLVGGIYTADPEKLSLAATMPRFIEMEQKYGSLIRAARATVQDASQNGKESGARYGLFTTLTRGMSSLVARLAERLPPDSIRLNSPVDSLQREGDGRWSVYAKGNSKPVRCAAVIVATSAPVAATIVEAFDKELATELAGIEYAGSSIVTLGYRRDQIHNKLDGFGFVVPEVEKRRILAGSFSSVKFDGRAPDGSVLIRVFLGGACHSEQNELPDEELRSVAIEELRDLLGTTGEPLFADVVRWPKSMPQYHVGHLKRVSAIEHRVEQWPGLELAGNAYHGVGIPNCVHSAELAAERVVQLLPKLAV